LKSRHPETADGCILLRIGDGLLIRSIRRHQRRFVGFVGNVDMSGMRLLRDGQSMDRSVQHALSERTRCTIHKTTLVLARRRAYSGVVFAFMVQTKPRKIDDIKDLSDTYR